MSVEIEELKKRLTRLEDRAGRQPEAISTNLLQINPVTKLVTASFSGVVNALGLTLPLSANITPATSNQVQWTNTSGAMVARVYSARDNATSRAVTVLESVPSVAGDQTFTELFAWDNSNEAIGNFMQFYVSAKAGATRSANINNNGTTLTLIDSTNISSWLKLASAANLMVQAGSVNVTIPLNTNAATSTVTFASAFSVAPIAIATGIDPAGNNIGHSAQSKSTTGFTARAFWTDGTATHAATTIPIFYIAIGAQ